MIGHHRFNTSWENGTGKSRTARAIATQLSGLYLSTDRLTGLMSFDNYRWTSVPNMDQYKGIPLSDSDRQQAIGFSGRTGSAVEELYRLKDEPAVLLRVAAFVRRALGRTIEMRETAGFLDPYVRVGNVDYSLLRDEGHGLRELVVLLTATYLSDWNLLVVDEPELHLHPSMVQLWMTELELRCAATGSRAVVVTHEPLLLRPTSSEDLRAVGILVSQSPTTIASHIDDSEIGRVSASLDKP